MDASFSGLISSDILFAASKTMAATGNGTTPVVFPTSQAKGSFVGEEFSNNLFSDLAPLLTLFGEQVR